MSNRSQLLPRCCALAAIAGVITMAVMSPLSAKQQPAAAKQPAADAPKAAAPAANAQPVPRITADAKLRKQMALDKPLMNLKEDDALRREVSLKIRKILREGALDNASKAIIDRWIQWRLYRMTITELPKPKKPRPRPAPPVPMGIGPASPMPGGPMPGGVAPVAPPPEPLPPLPYRRRLSEFNKVFLQEIRGAGKFQNNPPKKQAFRKYVLDGVIKKSGDLFDNNFYVRLNVVILLSRLNIVEGNFGGKGAVAYAAVAAPLLEIIRDKEQHDALRIPAVAGLRRIMQIGKPKPVVTNEIALELMAQLENKSSVYWYQMRLVEALGSVSEPLIQRQPPDGGVMVQKPFHVQLLLDVMRDPSRHWIVRAESAKSLGRVPLHGAVNAPLIAREIVALSNGMSAAYNKSLDKFYWHQCFLNTYLAFRPLDREEKAAIAQVKPATLISKFDANNSIVDAYKQVLPAVLHILKQPTVVNDIRANQPIPAPMVKATTTWLNENKPSVNRLAPNLPVLSDPEPTAAKVSPAAILPTSVVRDK